MVCCRSGRTPNQTVSTVGGSEARRTDTDQAIRGLVLVFRCCLDAELDIASGDDLRWTHITVRNAAGE